MSLQRLLLVGLAAGVLGAAGSANAAYRITGMDLYGHGVVTTAAPFAPPVGTHDYFHITLTLWDPFIGNPYAAIPTDATGTFDYSTIGGPWGFEVNIRDIGGFAACEACGAHFSLVNGALSGPFAFDAGVDPVDYMRVDNSSFSGFVAGPDLLNAGYAGTFVLDGVAIHTDAPVPVPEPASWVLMVAGFLGAGQALRSMAKRSPSRTTLAGLQ